MGFRHADTADGLALEIEFDDHRRLFADDPSVVTGFDCQELRRGVLDDTAVAVLNVDRALREEPDVRVHAEIGSADWLHIFRPSESHGIHHAFDASFACAADVEPHTPYIAALGATFDGGEQRIGCFRSA